MSTRSGKRIHNSFHENDSQFDVEQEISTTRKTRSNRLKENVEEISTTLMKNKKRSNYVSYPSDDEASLDTVDTKGDESRLKRTLRKNVLKEQNVATSSTVYIEPPTEVKKLVRVTRRTHKFAEEVQANQTNSEEEVAMVTIKKSKKGRKKKQLASEQQSDEDHILKKIKKKKIKILSTKTEKDHELQNDTKNNLTNTSTDLFHSAAGSPQSDLNENPLFGLIQPLKDLDTTVEKYDDEKHTEKCERNRMRSSARLNSANMSQSTPNIIVNKSRKRKSSIRDTIKNLINGEFIDKETDSEDPLHNTFNKISKKRKSSSKDTVSKDVRSLSYNLDDSEKNVSDSNTVVDHNDSHKQQSSTCTISDVIEGANEIKQKSTKSIVSDIIEDANEINISYDKDELRKSFSTDSVKDKNCTSDNKNITHNKEMTIDVSTEIKRQTRQSVLNTTFDKLISNSQIQIINESISEKPALINKTFEMDSDIGTNQDDHTRKLSINEVALDKNDLPSEIYCGTPNLSLRKSEHSKSSSKLSTEMNSTYDEEKSESTLNKDKKLDETFDKSSKSSLVSSDSSYITLDKSDISRISVTSDDTKENVTNLTPVLIESSLDESEINTSKVDPKCSAQPPLTPLKREGTFTKDGPEVDAVPIPESKTPTKRMSLPSPGCTPFHTNKVATKEKSVLNITQSIEKSRRSSLAETLPKTTKVMFCSPVNNPSVVQQQRRKVIKSSLKGSNKSFVFDESFTMGSRPARKRSYTQSDADDPREKRKRLVDGQQHSVDRLSRPRTSSASAKIGEPSTPSKKPGTPSKKFDSKISRTKLPNFAALHQKQFDKMESLGECQERKAKRAKQLLTPTGAITVLERSSPRENAMELQKSPTEPAEKLKEHNNEKQMIESKQPETPIKSLPTLKSLNPGYTRFGFKLNLDINPFSIPSSNDAKNKTISFSTRKDSKVKTSLFSISSKKDNTKPLKEIRSNLIRQATLPSLTGATSLRREVAKQTVMREKSFTDRRNIDRHETRTVIKGVRTNRRFELQMRMRNLDH